MKYRTHISTMIPLPSRTEDYLDPWMNGSFSCLFCLCLASCLSLYHDHTQYTPVYTLFWCPFQLQHASALPGLFAPLVSHKECFLSFAPEAGCWCSCYPPKKSFCCLTNHSPRSSSMRMVDALAFHHLSTLCAPGSWPAVESDWLFFWCP